ncbi:hypothetical protein [Candidatus Tokpelaia sp.]|uniref:hypothetical protein n=1 Tax=Candidatus Tokpelaia sp. TaxID=2233777 RepID=UPI00123C3632|nr:hypothetical protein [Candidatus Tokpelaia sp.]KAA6406301.1 hypothetical protein DPQ22_00320 [Candidatus Tokpelaia sp.]
MSNISQIPDMEERLKRLQSGAGGGIYNAMEARIATREADTENMKTNIADIKMDIRSIRKDM